ncbi:DUF3800 domain-containing protein [Candidatus Saccharibacteria bacterium]|nr:DUF3800 domain-containing protein [Candidatus Saccharibacteria bacterium]
MSKGKQLIFVDDSGDPGFKFNRSSSKYFVVCCIIFDNVHNAEFAGAGLKVLKDKLGWKQEREFKFHKSSPEQKKAFFNNIKIYDFKVRAVVVDKTKISEPLLKKSDSFYRFVIREVLLHYDYMREAKIYIDGSSGKNYRKQSASYLRKELNKGNHRMAELKMVNSTSDTLIQLADMVAGATRRKYEKDKVDTVNCLRYIKDKVDDIWEYGL